MQHVRLLPVEVAPAACAFVLVLKENPKDFTAPATATIPRESTVTFSVNAKKGAKAGAHKLSNQEPARGAGDRAVDDRRLRAEGVAAGRRPVFCTGG